MPMEAVSPNVMMNTLIGAMAGTLIAAFIVVLIHLSDDRIKGPDDVEKYLGVSVLGTIPLDNNLLKADGKKKKK